MSGGSFDYLYSKDAEELLSQETCIEEMGDNLESRGYTEALESMNTIRADIIKVKLLMEKIDKELSKNTALWKAV